MRVKLVFLFVFFSFAGLAQGFNADSLFFAARDYAFAGKYAESRQVCDSILEKIPNYTDVIVLKGRTLAWEKKHDVAREVLLVAYALAPEIEDVYVAIVDNELWSGNLGKAEKFCRIGLGQFPQSFPLLLKMAQIQYNLAEYNPALSSVDSALVQKPEDEPAQKLREQILAQLRQDKIKFSHSVDWFNVPFKRQLHITSLEYSKKMNRWTIIPRLNAGQTVLDTARLFEDLHPQIETDVYYQLSGWNYLFFNYGFAPREFFPKHRHGLELFQKLPLGFEASLGYRLLYFKPHTGSNSFVDIYTASLGKYWKSYWFAFRTYITPQESGADNSYSILGRYFYQTVDGFVELSLGSGFSVDESVFAQQNFQGTEYLHSYRIGLRGQYRYKRVCIFHAGAAIRFEEYFQQQTRNVYFLNGGVSFYL